MRGKAEQRQLRLGGLERWLDDPAVTDRRGIPLQRSAVGDRYVLEMMQDKGWLLGGENSCAKA